MHNEELTLKTSSQPKYCPKTSSPDTLTLGVKVQHDFGGRKQHKYSVIVISKWGNRNKTKSITRTKYGGRGIKVP